ncbi:MAG: substrate-binding domain-containing protein [Muribaculaceae bacterium]|nr:substrate-binding domain-containing protein [Muribaculaceae bacterium]
MSALFIIIICTGCTRKPKIDIAVSQCSGGEWRETMNDEMRREILFNDDYEINIDIVNADDNVGKQIADLRLLASRRPDVLLVAPAVADSLVDVITEIQRGGIPVVVFDRDVPGAEYTAFIGADNTEIGRQAARYARANIQGPIYALEITGDMNSTPARQRAAGFRDMADSLADFSILYTLDAGWHAELAQIYADSILRLHPEINLIFGHNDPTAELAAAAADSLGIRQDILVTGVDGAPSFGLKMLENGNIDATILYPTLGHETLRLALQVAQGADVPPRTDIRDLPAIDHNNMSLYQTHHRTMLNETEKVIGVKNTFDRLYQQHSIQRALLLAAVAIVLLLSFLLVSIWRSYKVRKKLHAQLEAATEAKVNFFTNVSHDLRTPLTMIGTAIERVSRHAELDNADASMMRLARKNTRILTRLINQILDFNKYDNEQLTLRLSRTDLHEFTEEMRLLFAPAVTSHGIAFCVENRLPQKCMGAIDIEKTERILFNIMSNAMKFTPANGKITLSVFPENETVVFRISDSGRGMTAEQLNSLFKRYSCSTKANPYGSGIGMSIAKAFVDLHGGEIKAESDGTHGSVITFSLPLRRTAEVSVDNDLIRMDRQSVEEELETIDTDTSSPDQDESLILVIDDNPDIRTLLDNILGDRYRIIKASSGVQGIKAACRFIPDAVICDIMMLDMDGIEVCRRLKDEDVTAHIPVIMLTACADDRKRVESYRSGADAYLNKPFDRETLEALLASILENRRRLQKSRVDELAASAPAIGEVKNDDSAENGDSGFYRRFLEVLDANIGNAALSVDDISARLDIDRTQLYRKIKATTNHSPSELIRMIRLKRARQLLTASDMQVKDVAAATGFASHAYFTKCYRAFFGETPGDSQRRTSKL